MDRQTDRIAISISRVSLLTRDKNVAIYQNRKLMCVTLSNERREQKDVDLGDYKRLDYKRLRRARLCRDMTRLRRVARGLPWLARRPPRGPRQAAWPAASRGPWLARRLRRARLCRDIVCRGHTHRGTYVVRTTINIETRLYAASPHAALPRHDAASPRDPRQAAGLGSQGGFAATLSRAHTPWDVHD